jgi:hypothetical protein
LFRDIQVSMGNQAGGGGGGGGGQERELARLFDLELDTAKNQYESAPSAAPSQGGDAQKQMDEQLERLKELARRQQQLADQQHSPQQQFQQRWEEEQLRREAEQLRQELQRQQRQQQQSQSGSQSQSASSASSASSGQSKSSSSQSASQRDAVRKAMEALSKAEDEMRNAASHQDASAQQRAANQLAQAQESMRNMMHQQANSGLSDLAEKARQLAEAQKDLGQRVKKMYGAEGVNTARTQEDGTPDMPEMNGPGYAGGWYRRRMQPVPDQPATGQEKSLAAEGDKLADQVQQLQNELQRQAQSLAGQQPEATRKMRKALSDAEQEEIAVRMKKSDDWLRQGFGSKTWPVEDSITEATKHLSKQIEEARQSAEKGQQAGSQPGGEGSLGQALSEVRSLREQLESQAQRANMPGGRGGQQQSEMDQLNQLRSQVGRGDRQLNGYFDDTMGWLRQMNGQAGLMDARLNKNALISLQRLEVELARRLEQRSGARSDDPESVPVSYRDAVATYFRTLSK